MNNLEFEINRDESIAPVLASIGITAIYKIRVMANGRTVASVDDEDNVAIDAEFASAYGAEHLTTELLAASRGSFESKQLLLKYAQEL